MKNLISILILLIFMLQSCGTKDTDSNSIFIGGTDKLLYDKDNESEQKMTKEAFEDYENIQHKLSRSVYPLHKIVKGDNYVIYVALPYNVNLVDMVNDSFKNEKEKNQLKSFNRIENNFIYRELIKDINSTKKYLVNITSPDSTLIYKFYESGYAKKRIKFNS
ncbi:MAG: hypothetical protein KIT33_11585 [Candidatus Kapabacteria bacterium]|nr:hypothetical protein [Ignavibacteriota bacterium]MCW5885601.1 hypothetical protein [Candidatus Kapabacteria bacterium]